MIFGDNQQNPIVGNRNEPFKIVNLHQTFQMDIFGALETALLHSGSDSQVNSCRRLQPSCHQYLTDTPALFFALWHCCLITWMHEIQVAATLVKKINFIPSLTLLWPHQVLHKTLYKKDYLVHFTCHKECLVYDSVKRSLCSSVNLWRWLP